MVVRDGSFAYKYIYVVVSLGRSMKSSRLLYSRCSESFAASFFPYSICPLEYVLQVDGSIYAA